MSDRERLVGAFDDEIARHREPGPELLDELLDHLDGELVDDLLTIVANRADDLTAVRCGTAALHRLAARLDGPDGELLAACADLEHGRAAVVAEQWSEAEEPLRYAVDVLDGPDRALGALLLADALDHTGQRSEAVRCWTDARVGFLAADEPAGAGMATMMLTWAATEAGERGRRVEDAYLDAADLLARGGDQAQAGECATRAGGLVLERVAALDEPASAEAADAAARAYAPAERHGAHELAVRLAITAATYGADAGWAWPRVAAWCAAARRDVERAAVAPDVAERWRASVDLAEGVAAVGRAMPVAAEPPLRAALATFRRIGPPAVEEFCLARLAALRAYTEQADPGQLPDLLGGRAWDAGDGRSAAAAVRALVAVHGGDPNAGALVDSARSAADEGGPDTEHRRVLLDLTVAASRPDDRARLRSALDAADRFLAGRATTLSPGVARGVRLVRDLASMPFHAPDAATEVLVDVEARLLQNGAGLLAAQIAVARAALLLDGGDARRALDLVLPATLALDAVRFALDDADRRRRWNAVVARGFGIAHRAALRCGDHRTVAELLEVARANGAPVTGTADDPLSDLLAAVATPQDPPVTPDRGGAALPGAAAVSGTDPERAGRTALAPPALIRAPWGHVALAGPLDRALRYHDPVRASETVDWMVACGAGT